MSLSPENELIIRKAIADRLGALENIGNVLPAPIFFVDRADFFNQISGLTQATQKGIETAAVKFCAVYPLSFTQLETVNLIYEIYLFCESSLERKDETAAPDAFLKKLLKRHSEFTSAWLGIRNEFETAQTLPDLDGFSVKRSAPLEQTEFIRHNELCEFVPEVRGYAARMQLTINLLENNSC